MAEGAGFTIYPLEFYPQREILKEFLMAHHIGYEAADMTSANALTELRLKGLFVMAHVLQKGMTFLMSKDLFTIVCSNEEKILHLC